MGVQLIGRAEIVIFYALFPSQEKSINLQVNALIPNIKFDTHIAKSRLKGTLHVGHELQVCNRVLRN